MTVLLRCLLGGGCRALAAAAAAAADTARPAACVALQQQHHHPWGRTSTCSSSSSISPSSSWWPAQRRGMAHAACSTHSTTISCSSPSSSWWPAQRRGMAHGAGSTHSTTILCVRRGPEVVIIGDGQATQNDFIVKPNVRKVRRIGTDAVAGFAGVAVDGLALLERLEKKLEEHPGQLQRAAVELAKMWRQDKLLRDLDASLVLADATTTLWVNGSGDVVEAGPDGVIGIGSGADFAESAARALLQLHADLGLDAGAGGEPATPSQQQQNAGAGGKPAPPSAAAAGDAARVLPGGAMPLLDIAHAAMRIAAQSCVYTNVNWCWFHLAQDGSIQGGDSSGASASSTTSDEASSSSGGALDGGGNEGAGGGSVL